MDMQMQIALHESRKEFCLADILRGIIEDEELRLREKVLAKKKADNLMFEDRDY